MQSPLEFFNELRYLKTKIDNTEVIVLKDDVNKYRFIDNISFDDEKFEVQLNKDLKVLLNVTINFKIIYETEYLLIIKADNIFVNDLAKVIYNKSNNKILNTFMKNRTLQTEIERYFDALSNNNISYYV